MTRDWDGLDQLAADYGDDPRMPPLALLGCLLGAIQGSQDAPDPAAALELLGDLVAEVMRIMRSQP